MIRRLVSCHKNNTLRSSWDSKAALTFSAILHPPVPPFTLLFYSSLSSSTLHLPLPFSCSVFHSPLPHFAFFFQPSPCSSRLHPPLHPLRSSILHLLLPPFILLFHPSPSSPEAGKGGTPVSTSVRASPHILHTISQLHSPNPTAHNTPLRLLLYVVFFTGCVFQETQDDNKVCPPNLLFDYVVPLYTGLEDTVS